MNELDELLEEGKQSGGFDIKEILFKYSRVWPLLILGSVVSVLGVFIYHRYTTEIFLARTSILIPDTNQNVDESLLNNFGFNFGATFLNELEILKSTSLSREAIANQGFEVSYFTKGRIKTIEEYKTLPFRVEYSDHSKVLNKEFRIAFEEGNKFRLSFADDSEDEQGTLYLPHTTIEGDGYALKVVFDKYVDLTGKEYFFKYNSPDRLISELHGSLQVNYAKAFTSIAVITCRTTVPVKNPPLFEAL